MPRQCHDGPWRVPPHDDGRYLYIACGTVELTLAEGPPGNRMAGDVVVQNATLHRWRNASSEPATLVTFDYETEAPPDLD